jgi:hypothetical protein
MAQSEFDKWFTAQFGPPIFKTPDDEQLAKEELVSMRIRLDALERERWRHDQYEAKRTAAQYAWQAKPATKFMAKKLAKCSRRKP